MNIYNFDDCHLAISDSIENAAKHFSKSRMCKLMSINKVPNADCLYLVEFEGELLWTVWEYPATEGMIY